MAGVALALSNINEVAGEVVTLATSVRTLGESWYKASNAREEFISKVAKLERTHKSWEERARLYGVSSDGALRLSLADAKEQLQREEARLKRLDTGCGCLWWCFCCGTDIPEQLGKSLEDLDKILSGTLQADDNAEVLLLKIAENQLKEASKLALPFGWDRRHVHLHKIEEHLKKLLNIESTGYVTAFVVLLYGSSGSGKSIVAQNLTLDYRDAAASGASVSANGCRRFDDVFYLQCGQKVDSQAKHTELLGMLLPRRSFEKEQEQNPAFGKLMLTQVLRERRSLIIFDDVWEAEFLKDMVGVCGRHVRILVTSQIRTLCDHAPFEAELVPMNIEPEDSFKILKIQSGFRDEGAVPEDVEKHMSCFVADVGGHPEDLASLAFRIEGRDREKWQHWEKMIRGYWSDQQRGCDDSSAEVNNSNEEPRPTLTPPVISSQPKSREDDVIASNSTIDHSKLSRGVTGPTEDVLCGYDQLDSPCRSVFLDICCLMEEVDWDWAQALGSGSEVITLRDTSLVKQEEKLSWRKWTASSYNPRFTVSVHDSLALLAERESRQEASNRVREGLLPTMLQDRVRVRSQGGSLPTILQDAQSEDECKTIQGLDLSRTQETSFSAQKLDAMHETLRILRLDSTEVKVQGECHKIPSKLQICSVGQFPYRDLSGLHDLRVLDICASKHSSTLNFEEVKLPKSLQILRLKMISKLKRFHASAFEKCSSLRSVKIYFCANLEELPASLCLCPIRVLMLDGNSRLRSLPANVYRLQFLESFYIKGSLLREFPRGVADLKKLRELFVTGFQGLPERVDFSHISGLEYLHVDYSELQKTETDQKHDGFGMLPSLKLLDIRSWRGLQELRGNLSQLTNLRALRLSRLEALKELPQGFQNLTGVSEVIMGCKSLRSLPQSFRHLTALEMLNLNGCKMLTEVPGGFGNFPHLSDLNLGGMDSLREWPGGLSKLSSLEILQLPGRFNLVAFTACSNLTALKSVELSECAGVTKLLTGLGNLKSLADLKIRDCRSLQDPPEAFAQLNRLKALTLRSCGQLTELPAAVEELLSLADLTLISCTKLRQLPDQICRLRSLQLLKMTDCEALEKLPSEFGNIVSLRTVQLLGCKSLTELPSNFGSLHALKNLVISDAYRLQQLPETFSNLESLQSLTLHDCTSLRELPGRFGNLSRLKKVDLGGCSSLRKLPEDFGKLAFLQLNLDGCTNLK